MSHHLISAEHLAYTYPDGTRALDGITFTIKHGEAVGVVGANGAGKSTLLLLLAGVLLPGGGSLRVGDIPLCRRTLPQIRRSVGLIFQDPDDQLFMPTVHDDVAFGPVNLGLPPDEVEARAAGALAKVGAVHLRDRPPHRLSGGEKRAAAIAAVLAMDPNILVLDEPSAGLDPWARRRLIEILKSFEHTRIVATHDLDLVLDLCPRTIVLDGGRIAADGPTALIFDDEALLAAAHLEKPLSMQGCPRCGG
ncbi:MAG: energy-coupling factor ABC transporter ATP-binding protein [Patescibacteria group bacterium]